MDTHDTPNPTPPEPSDALPGFSDALVGFSLWLDTHCYACGLDPAGPRDMTRGNQSPDLPDPTSHRWCFE